MHYPGIAPGTGRAFSVHHHGQASTSDMDGWAEQFICAGESKVPATNAQGVMDFRYLIGTCR